MNKIAIKIDNLASFDNIDKLFGKLSKIGYSGIEIYNPNNISAENILEKLKEYNLSLTSTHVTFEYIMDNYEQFYEYQSALKCCNAVMTYGDIHGKESLYLLIDNLKAINSRLKRNNINLLYHNHIQEFRKYGNSEIAIEKILKHTEVNIEYDAFWTSCVGINPINFYNQHLNRIKLIHIKDGIDGKPCLLGKGNFDCKSVYKTAIQNNADWIIVELPKDEKDILNAAEYSFEYIKNNF